MRPRRRFRGRSGAPSQLRWCGNSALTEGVLGGPPAYVAYAIVAPSDYAQQATLEPGGVTLMRTHLSVCVRGAVGAIVTVALYHHRSTETLGITGVYDPQAVLGLASGHLMWVRQFLCLGAAVNAYSVIADIKARRKLEDETVSLVFRTDAAVSTHSFYARALIKGG